MQDVVPGLLINENRKKPNRYSNKNYAAVVGKSHRTSSELFLQSPWDYRFCKKKVVFFKVDEIYAFKHCMKLL